MPKKYGEEDKWHLQWDSISVSQDDKGVYSATATYEALAAGASAPPAIDGMPIGSEFPMNSFFGLLLFCSKQSATTRTGKFLSITCYYIGLASGGSSERSEVRTEWSCNTSASPIQTHPKFVADMQRFAVMEDGLFVDFPASAPHMLGGVTDFYEPAVTLKVSWMEKHGSSSDLKEWLKKIGKICEPPDFAKADIDLPPTYNLLLTSVTFGFYAKGAGEEAKYSDWALEYQLSQKGGWNDLIYNEA